jgi:signal peptidase I
VADNRGMELPLPQQDSGPLAEEPREVGIAAEETAHPMQLDAVERAQLEAPALPGELLPRLPAPVLPRWPDFLAVLRGATFLFRTPLRLVAAGLFLYLFAFNFSVVRGSSMAPGIHDGDRILINQFSYFFQTVERGDVVVLRYPRNPELDYIKRIVGLPGDEVVMAGGLLWVNGKLFEEAYLGEADPYSHLRETVAAGHYLVLGDNRLHSSDSREFGQVPAELLRGKVDLRLWPPSRIGRVR